MYTRLGCTGKQHLAAAAMCTLLLGCGPDATISSYADSEAIYVLQSIDESPFTTRTTITFPEKGVVIGTGPCNHYRAEQTAPYPWFEVAAVATTKLNCPALPEEAEYLATLSEMNFAEIFGPVLLLSNSSGTEMVFQIEDRDTADSNRPRAAGMSLLPKL